MYIITLFLSFSSYVKFVQSSRDSGFCIRYSYELIAVIMSDIFLVSLIVQKTKSKLIPN